MRRAALALSPLALLAACSLVAGLGPEPGPLPAPVSDAAVDVDAPPDVPDGAGGDTATIGPCRIYPPDNPWNRDVSNDPVDTDAMNTIMPNMATSTPLHADWGDTMNGYGVPFDVAQAPPVPITFFGNPAQSDQAPCADMSSPFCYPIPPNAKVEKDGQHVLVLDTTGAPDDCTLYELVSAARNDAGAGWSADHGAIFHLGSNDLRPDGWVSTDAAGLPILPGLVRFEETSLGEIRHAMRFTMRSPYLGYIHPATHSVGAATAGLPPMGLRLRLKANYDLTNVSGLARVILTAMKKYGIILADRGSDWYVTGERNDGWTAVMDSIANELRNVHGSDFEIVKSGPVLTTGL